MYKGDTYPDYRSCKFGTEEDSKFGVERLYNIPSYSTIQSL